MPRKFKTEASVMQDRENQRRSRARRKDYVQDLETRLREYERRGVGATVEMQQAARAVEAENSALRSILADFLAPREIEARLRAAGGDMPAVSDGLRTHSTDNASFKQEQEQQQQQQQQQPLYSHQDARNLLGPQETNSHRTNYEPASRNSPHADVDVQYHPALKASTMEKSCTEAALILSQLGGHSDARRFRNSLGCVGDEECVVRNTVLMQMMDEKVT
ncbi:hypothetical protein N3K66_007721 [Trichothecium roseum]|uniref:Uncharacterized protein n=1 Tax=Trichothecium roseum TaxID=47278 RepID=A0ACC0UUS8_9HYPO|nr:hypothetical protein N3K66_007721 [Trichothecium roseum]